MVIKDIVRKEILQKRKFFDELNYYDKNEKVQDYIEELINSLLLNNNTSYQNYTLGFYLFLKGEPDLTKLIIKFSNNYFIALPKILRNELFYIRYQTGSELEYSAFKNLMHPKHGIKVIPNIIVVPALAYSIRGIRLGFGFNFFNDFLIKMKKYYQVITIGVCFNDYLFSYLPIDGYEVSLDYVVTDKMIIKI